MNLDIMRWTLLRLSLDSMNIACPESMYKGVAVLLSMSGPGIIEYRSMRIWAVSCYVAIRLGSY